MVVPGIATDPIVARPAHQNVVTRAAHENVVAGAALQLVVARLALQLVVVARSDDLVVELVTDTNKPAAAGEMQVFDIGLELVVLGSLDSVPPGVRTFDDLIATMRDVGV